MAKSRSDAPRTEKPTIIVMQAGPGRHISAVTLFRHLAAALEGCELCDVATITIYGDGSVSLDGETVYFPRRVKQREGAR